MVASVSLIKNILVLYFGILNAGTSGKREFRSCLKYVDTINDKSSSIAWAGVFVLAGVESNYKNRFPNLFKQHG